MPSVNSLNYPNSILLPPLHTGDSHHQPLSQRLLNLRKHWDNHFQYSEDITSTLLRDITYRWLAHLCTSHQIRVYPRNIGITPGTTSQTEHIVFPRPTDEETLIVPCRIPCQECDKIYDEIGLVTNNQSQTSVFKSEVLKTLDLQIQSLNQCLEHPETITPEAILLATHGPNQNDIGTRESSTPTTSPLNNGNAHTTRNGPGAHVAGTSNITLTDPYRTASTSPLPWESFTANSPTTPGGNECRFEPAIWNLEDTL